MRYQTSCTWAAILTLVAITIGMAPFASAQSTPGPVFSTQTPTSGEINHTFVVFLPLFNVGTATAANIRVTSATLGQAAVINPKLPLSLATLAVGDHNVLDLQFDDSNLVVGHNYLLTVRGTYGVGTQTFGFAVNRFIAPAIPSGSVLTAMQHWMVLDAVRTMADSLPGIDSVADNQAMLAFLRSRPEFVDSDVDGPSYSVWATFANGEQLIIANDRNTFANLPNPTQSAVSFSNETMSKPDVFQKASTLLVLSSSAPVQQYTEIPYSSAASLQNALVSTLEYSAVDVKSDIAKMLMPQNYNVSQPDGSVDISLVDNLVEQKGTLVGSLWSAGGDGVFYFSSHGGFWGRFDGKGPVDYAVWTTTKADIMVDQILPFGVLGSATTPGALMHLMAKTGTDIQTGQPIYELDYGITAKFVKDYFKPFGPASFVYIDACSSDDPRSPGGVLGQDAQDFKQAFFDKGATVYAGWTATADDRIAGNSARLVFDRLLGANQFFLEKQPTASGSVFNQRPFDWGSVLEDLPKHNINFAARDFPLGKDPVTGATLIFDVNADTSPKAVFGLLAPSIGNAVVAESNTENLILSGLLGTDPGVGGGVTVGGANPPAGMTSTQGGVELNCIWHTDLGTIGCVDLHPSGSGSSGNVQVTVRGHNSNIARITEWNGVFTYNMPAGGPGSSLNQRITLNPVFRADTREFRPFIHEPPILPSFPIEAVVPTTTAQFACTGSDRIVTLFPGGSTTETDTWTGSGDLPSFDLGTITFGMHPPTNYFAATGTAFFSNTMITMGFAAHGPGVCNNHDHIVTTGAVPTDNDTKFALFGALDFVLNLDPTTATIQPPPSGALLVPSFQCPGPQSCNGFFKWNAIPPVADTAPDPNSAR